MGNRPFAFPDADENLGPGKIFVWVESVQKKVVVREAKEPTHTNKIARANIHTTTMMISFDQYDRYTDGPCCSKLSIPKKSSTTNTHR